MKPFQKISIQIKRKLAMNKLLCAFRVRKKILDSDDDKVIQYIEKCDWCLLDTEMFKMAYEGIKDKRSREAVIMTMINVGGSPFVMKKNKDGCTALHYVCDNHIRVYYDLSLEVVMNLIEVGGRQLVMEKSKDGLTALHDACDNYRYGGCTPSNRLITVIMKMIEVGGLKLVMEKDNYGYTVLHRACRGEVSNEVFMKLMNEGGRKLVMEKNMNGHTAFFYLCWFHSSRTEVIMKMLELGGQELVAMMEKDNYGYTVLHRVCLNRLPSPTCMSDVLMKMVELGGRELVIQKDNNGCNTALHLVCAIRASSNVILKMIELGGRELVMQKDIWGETALHYACRNRSSSSTVIMKMIKLGGQELLMQKDRYRAIDGYMTPLHHLCECNKKASTKDILKLIELGGRNLIMQKDNYGCTALHHACANKKTSIKAILILIMLGGSQLVMKKNKEGHTALDCAYLHHKAPSKVITVLEEFNDPSDDDETIEVVKVIIESMTRAQLHFFLNMALEYGLKWSITKELVASNVDDVINEYDSSSGLRIFMVAALGTNDLSSIYSLMQMSPAFS